MNLSKPRDLAKKNDTPPLRQEIMLYSLKSQLELATSITSCISPQISLYLVVCSWGGNVVRSTSPKLWFDLAFVVKDLC